MSRKVFKVKVCKAKNIPKMDIIGHADPYVILLLDGRSRRTEFVKNDANPVWNMVLEFDFPVQESLEDKVLEVNCYDHDVGKKDDFIGKVVLPINKYLDGETHSQWHDLMGENGTTGSFGSLLIELTLVK